MKPQMAVERRQRHQLSGKMLIIGIGMRRKMFCGDAWGFICYEAKYDDRFMLGEVEASGLKSLAIFRPLQPGQWQQFYTLL